MAKPAQIAVKPDKTRLLNLLDEIAQGNIKIPVFQREFVWKPNQMIELFDSIVKGYPIGSLLFWKPGVEYHTKEYIGPYRIDNKGNSTTYVLDGFQRITSLFGILTNPKNFNKDENSQELRDYSIYYDLKQNEFTYLKSKKEEKVHIISLFKIVDTYEFLDFLREIEREIDDKAVSNPLIVSAKNLSKIFYDYEIPFVEIKGGDIKSAVEIFSRINSTGTDISEDFMLSALSYNETTNFLFSESITEFLNSLSKYNFDTLKRDTVLDCIASAKGKMHFDVKIEELLLPNLEELATKSFVHIRKAIEFLYVKLLICDIRLLPYPSQLIFISEYFRLNPFPSEDDLDKLQKWFWITSYSNYFTIYSLSQQRYAYKVFCEFAMGNHADGVFKLNQEDLFDSLEFPEKLNFTGVRTKTLQLFMLRNMCIGGRPIEETESIKEHFIFDKKDRAPANMILRLGSEFESDRQKKDIRVFIENSDPDFLERFFIDRELVQLYINNDIENFISIRENKIKKSENLFVASLGVFHRSQ